MSPGFRNVLRLARIPVDSSEPVRRKFGSRLIGIVTVCLLPLLGFHFVAGHLGGWRLYWPVPGRG